MPLPRFRSSVLLLLLASVVTAAPDNTARLTIQADRPGAVINPNLYGQFAEHLGHGIYGGIWVGPDSPIPNTRGYRNDVLAALQQLHVPVLRWPGGCFADEYHWKDGIGPRAARPAMINTSWGGVTEDNSFGTHEFLDLCELLGTEPYVCVNVGSGTVQEAMEWVEYMTSGARSPMANLRRAHGREQPWKVHYLAVGNESWGCGGSMRPEFCADNFRRYNTFIKNYTPGPENRIQRIACGASDDNYGWTETMMKLAGEQMNGLSLHYYTVPTGDWQAKGSATAFGEDQYFSTLRRALHIDELITRHAAVMDQYDPKKKVGLVVDEWGVWTDVEPGTNPGFLYQQNSLRDALLAALHFHIFHQHADRISMANIAQMINVLQAMILTDQEKMVLTPTYHVFEMFRVHQGATVLPLELSGPDYAFGGERIPAVSASASRDAAGKVHLSLVNTNPSAAVPVTCRIAGFTPRAVTGRILTAAAINSVNTFAMPHSVEPQPFTGATLGADGLTLLLPAKSVVVLEL